ncbi:cytochrome P450 family protein [Rhizoctonia solani]|uniref:Cytochrome P450 family protein n=1 Tax=Rhizoctonia solani TaxID=456999 RepID=A0A8H8T0Z7_9AGAM|nr:cytochrome P450 family protein [Rhizoctonia solani]QRW23983.1 cytochrome P450 family protein [Rhizoctonia solani]
MHLVQYSTALGALAALIYYVAPYLLDPYDYRRRFPGPPLAGLTNWWMSNVVRAGNHSEVVWRLHEKYGTFVRLGPNHISIADPDALEAVYGHGSGVLKSDFYRSFQSGPKANVFDTSDKIEHSKKRKRLANIFSPQNVTFEPRVRSHIRQLCAQWDLRCEEAARGFSGVNWVSNSGQAVMNVCAPFLPCVRYHWGSALGSPFRLIQAQKDSSLSIESVDASGEPVLGAVEIPVIKTLADSGRDIVTLGVFPLWTRKFLQLLPWNISGVADRMSLVKLAQASVDARLKRGSRKNSEDAKHSIDLIDKLLEAKNEDGNPLSFDELWAEALLLIIAGSDTRAIPGLFVKERLVIPPYDAIANYDDIKSLPYLNACVKEALRVHSTVGTGMPRVVPPGKSITVAGQTFKAGSRVSAWTLAGGQCAVSEQVLCAILYRPEGLSLPTTKMVIHETFARGAAHCEVAIHRRTTS